MEYSVEITGRDTPELFMQLHRYTFRWMPAFFIVGYGGYILWSWLSYDSLSLKITYTVIYSLLALLFSRYPRWIARRAYKNKLKYYSGTMPESVSSFGEQILLRDVDSSHTIPYSRLKRVVFLKDCIALTLTDHKTIGIPNREFTRGSLEELKQLLREKCPELKISE